MKVLTINPRYYPHTGGVITVIKNINERLVKRNHSCSVMCINSDNLPADEYINDVRVIRINSPVSRYLYGFSPDMFYYIRKDKNNIIEDANIIHIHMYHKLLSIEAIYLIKAKNKPIVFSPHYHAIGHSKFRNFLHKFYSPIGKKMFKYVDKVICVSEYESNLVQKNLGVNKKDIKVIPHGVNLTDLKFYKKKAKNDPNISLLYVGRLVEHKGVQYILKSMRNLIDIFKMNPLLEIVGEGLYEKKLREIAKDLHLDGHVIWNKNLSEKDLRQKYKEADVFLLLSRAEAYGLVVADALTSKTPCIVANKSALSEFVGEPGCFGIEHPPDPEKLASLILKIYNNEVQIGPFSESKIRTWDKVADEYEELYRELTEI